MANRQQRRAAAASEKEKLARDAKPEDILPGGHGPTNLPGAGDVMTRILRSLQEWMPGWDFTLFAFEPPSRAKAEDRLPRFNYGSTVERADMLAVLKAFIMKNEDPSKYERMAKLDSFMTTQETKGSA